MAYRWIYDDAGKPLAPEAMTADQRANFADIVASAIEDGGPSLGADYLMWLRRELGAATNSEILRRLLDGGDVDEYLERHWEAQRIRA